MTITKKFLQNSVLAGTLISLLLFTPGCMNNRRSLKNGVWRATLERADGHQVVFNFAVTDSSGQEIIYVFNATERMRVDSIIFRGDSVFIQMPFFDSYFSAKINADGSLQGSWTKDYGDRLAVMPFHAIPGDSMRLPAYARPAGDISGSWAVTIPQEQDTFRAIGLFQQSGNLLTGTFMTPSGDYRYLQGVVSGDTMKLSGFDGCHALLFTAILEGADTLRGGKLYSINSKAASWFAERKQYDSLPAAYAVSDIKPGTVKLDFRLRDMQAGKEVSLSDSAFQGKVVVIQLLGSWCPNCMDETAFFTRYYRNNHQRGVAFIGVDFERTADF